MKLKSSNKICKFSEGKQQQKHSTLQRGQIVFLHYCINNCSSAKQVDLSAPIEVEISMFAAEAQKGRPWGADGHFSAQLFVLNWPPYTP